ncbi:amino acid ABC transporter permease [Rhodococcus sp. ACPA4]|uniref:Amino acid ABC transporter membrane protein 1 (PAAT family) n=2 Tax=Nocardiaceae TaxID=85025 RepID=A0A652YK80_NOCGL|nr:MULTISPECIES: amino acid ABC transporter permease [Rhodococcus]NMD61847.1 amino acid ABC transporter permease [Nocardia globerula]NRI64098.1 amino acid ABC transporter permease [Rhodococcus sp. MS16]KJF22316.1 Inner membrane amino-acid ABC transporter permease protein yecS [Rhodococcus sp. AD45]MCE4268596.1 amino acid ABC transporter permease [Rhodococcus globerulus]MDV6265517.1 amino acid ABC transporter permease [Rhodococcus globerulus]
MKILDDYGSQILEAFWTTIQLTIFSAIGALILGVIVAAMRVSPVPVARFLGAAYVTVFRNTPLTLILLFCVFGLYQTLDISLASTSSSTFVIDNNFRLAVLGLSVYTASFVCESIRAGINTVHAGQAEAGRSLGLTFLQNLRLIVLPQAFRAVIAPLGSVLIALTKNSTVAAVIGVSEASKLMKEILENEAALFVTAGIFAVGFVILTLPTGLLFGKLAKKFEVAR